MGTLRWNNIAVWVDILLIDSCYKNRDKLGPDELATWLVCRRYLPKQIKSYKLCHSLLFRKLSEFKRGPVYLVWSHQCTVNFLQLDADRDLIFSTLSDRLIRFSFISLSSLLCYFSVVITNHADKWFTKQRRYGCLLERNKIASFSFSDNCITLFFTLFFRRTQRASA